MRYSAVPQAVAELRDLDVAFIVWHRRDFDAATWDKVKAAYGAHAELWHEDEQRAVFKP